MAVRTYDGRRDMRSLADALAKLRELDGFSDGGNFEIKTMEILLPDRRALGLMAVLGPRHHDESGWIIRMPSAVKFTARTTIGTLQTYDIALLNDAISDSDGNVKLAGGQFLHQIDLIPAPIPCDFTATDDETVRHALKFLQVEDRCYLPIDEELLLRRAGIQFPRSPRRPVACAARPQSRHH